MFPFPLGLRDRSIKTSLSGRFESIARRMKPELVLISAGFDAHRLDPVGSLGLESEDFGQMTQRVVEVARQYAGGRVVSLLEGGYNAAAVAECVDFHLDELIR